MANILLRTLSVAAVSIACLALTLRAEDPPRQVTVIGPDGKPVTLTNPAVPPPGSENPNDKKSDNDKSKAEGKRGETEGKSGDEKEEPPEPKVIRRGSIEPGEADPDELNVKVGPDGKVAFQFRNQPWLELVQWLAQISESPLDWQELPGDRVNMRSPGRYTVTQAKDLFNRHLLARGFTLLELPGGITVAKTEGINPAMVPRVSRRELIDLMPHTFVRTSLVLGWLNSEKMAEELKPMISSNGKLTALTTTNRIEAMDAAINLQQIADLLEQERDDASRDSLAPEFRLRHIAAEVAKTMLEEFLGVEKKQPMTAQQMQMLQQMRQRNPNQPPPQPKKPDISIVANIVQNSVLIRAPIDRIAIASEFIKRIDVPSQSMMSLADVESRVEVFRLFSIGAKQLIEIIDEMNVLEPTTRVRADEDNQAIIVSGSAADRFIIGKLVKRLDGSGRQFEVLQLRRLDATEVAESIAFLMGKEKDDEDDGRSRRYYYYGYGGSDDDDKGSEDEFRVAANSRFRQVMLWANEYEMEQVRNLLIKLGELPPPGGSNRRIRRIEASTGPETYDYLLELKQQFKIMSGAELELPNRSEFVDPIADEGAQQDDGNTESGLMKEPDDGENDSEKEDPPEPDDSKEDLASSNHWEPSNEFVSTNAEETVEQADDQSNNDQPVEANDLPGANIRSSKDFDRFFGKSSQDSNATKADPTGNKRPDNDAPIQIKLDPNGNLVLMGDDTKTLDKLEDLMLRMTPPRRPYHVFKIKHQSAGYVRLNLVEYFENNEETESEADRLYRWWYDLDEPEDNGPTGLGRDGELRFVYDPDTNTIVVSGASPSQLRTIGELIELWDVAEPVNKRRMRYTKLVSIEFGRAEDIAETVKEAYRDLLSSNDKTFAQQGRGGGGPGGAGGAGGKSSGRDDRGSGLVDSENGRDGGDVDFSFKGKLSLGVDKIGNTLLVSAEGESLLDLVEDMIKKLDMAAKPAGNFEIMSITGTTNPETISRVIEVFGGKSAPASPQPDSANQGGPNGQPTKRPGQP